MYWEVGRQTLVLAVEPIGNCEMVPVPLGCGLEIPGEHRLGHLHKKRAFMKSMFPEEKREQNRTKQESGYIGVGTD